MAAHSLALPDVAARAWSACLARAQVPAFAGSMSKTLVQLSGDEDYIKKRQETQSARLKQSSSNLAQGRQDFANEAPAPAALPNLRAPPTLPSPPPSL